MKNPFTRLIHSYTYNLKIKSKLIISHTILLLLPTAVVTGFLFMRLYSIVLDDAIRSEQALSAQTVNSIERLIENAAHVSKVVEGTGPVRGLFNVTLAGAGYYRPETEKMDSLYLLASNLTDHSVITGIRIYYDDGTYPDLSRYNLTNQALFLPISSVHSPWLNSISASDENRLLCPGQLLSDEEKDSCGDLAVITRIPYARTGQDWPGYSGASAYVAVYFSADAMTKVLDIKSPVQNKAAFIVSAQNMLVASSDPDLASVYFTPYDGLAPRMGNAGEYHMINYKPGNAYSAYFPIHGSDWYMVSILPASHISDYGNWLMLRIILLYLLFVTLALFIALLLSNSIAERIIAVAYQMETVRTGRPKPMKPQCTGWDEIGILTDTYNYMTGEINRLMDSQEQTAEELRGAEFRALQAQINPHFLYNSLDMINWLSRTGRKEEVTRAIQALSQFYKLTLSKKELVNTIEEELKHISLYMELQNMRFDNCVQLVVDVQEELYGYTIPKLTFQPIIENALLHGIMMKEEKTGSILLTGWMEGTDMVFIISDDGAGIPPEKLETLLEGEKRHIGLYNTNLRLKMLYGEAYGLSFSSRPGQGTEVTVRLPAMSDSERT